MKIYLKEIKLNNRLCWLYKSTKRNIMKKMDIKKIFFAVVCMIMNKTAVGTR